MPLSHKPSSTDRFRGPGNVDGAVLEVSTQTLARTCRVQQSWSYYLGVHGWITSSCSREGLMAPL